MGVAARLPLNPSWGYKATLAGVYYPRVHTRSKGAFGEDEFESIFLRYLLPGINGVFDGEIDSKTKVYRVAAGFGPSDSNRWSAGWNIDYIDCKTGFCGVHATSNGYTTVSAGATAYSYGFGFKYRPSPILTVAGSISDINTQLDVGQVTTDNAGTRNSSFRTSFPKKVTLGMAYRQGPSMLLTGSYEITKGHYGRNSLDLQTLRMGAEINHSDSLASRFGLIAPVRMHSDQLQDISLPFPVAPTLGLGWRLGHLRADIVIYAHPVMSVHKNRASPSADLNITLGF